ncbi:hypothetical protein AB0L82_42750 [Nocardia sp. NPDC052001]|uniref:hypothetical protein n=1 Tax=Nocardia sp. NPDC052001 TaxID=3154853 RepID=UPI0034210ADE
MRIRLEALAVCTAAVLAGMAVTTPIDFGWAAAGSTPNLQLMLFNVPRAAACAALAAVLVSVMCESVTVRTTWLIASGSALLLASNHLLARAMSGEVLSLGLVDTIVGGALLGALPALAGRRRTAQAALLLGALSGVIIAGRFTVTGHGDDARSALQWALFDPPPMALIILALGLLIWGAWTHRHAEPAPTAEVPLRPVAAVLVLLVLSLLRTDWLAGQNNWSFRMIAGIGLTALATLVAALLLPGRDGVLLALAFAFTVAGGAVVLAGPLPAWSVPLVIAAVAAGLACGVRWPRPVAAVAVTIALAVFATTTRVHAPIPVALIAMTVAAVGGYCLATVLPQDPPTTVVALVTLITPSIVAALVNRRYHHIADSKVWFRSPSWASWAPGWAAVVVTASAGIIALALPHLRHSSPPTQRPSAPMVTVGCGPLAP